MIYRKLCIIFLILCCSACLPAVVNGQLTQIGDKYVLQVWGSHYERGYATGYLMADNIMNVFSYYFYTSISGSNPNTYNYYQQFHQNNFLTNERYTAEAEGMLAGMTASGASVYHSGLQRNLNVNDLLFANAVVDIAGYQQGKELELGCSSLSSWGMATVDDPFLQGGIVITRLLDWSRNNTLIANPLLVVHYPSEPDECKWISFAYPGMFGALSAISENGAAAFLNMGNIHTHPNTTNLTNVLFDIRSGLERTDYNNDGVYSTEDVFAAVADGNHVGGTITHNIQQWADSSRAAIIETNNSGTVRRLYNQNSNLNGDNLAATNHFRNLYEPVACSRYSRIIDSLNVGPIISAERQITVMKGAGGVANNLMMIQYQPNNGNILWSTASNTAPAYTQPPLVLNANDLFVFPTAVSDETVAPAVPKLSVYPNPLRVGQELKLGFPGKIASLQLYNLRGQMLLNVSSDSSYNLAVTEFLRNRPSGVYLLRVKSPAGEVATGKLLYLK